MRAHALATRTHVENEETQCHLTDFMMPTHTSSKPYAATQVGQLQHFNPCRALDSLDNGAAGSLHRELLGWRGPTDKLQVGHAHLTQQRASGGAKASCASRHATCHATAIRDVRPRSHPISVSQAAQVLPYAPGLPQLHHTAARSSCAQTKTSTGLMAMPHVLANHKHKVKWVGGTRSPLTQDAMRCPPAPPAVHAPSTID